MSFLSFFGRITNWLAISSLQYYISDRGHERSQVAFLIYFFFKRIKKKMSEISPGKEKEKKKRQ